MRKSNEIIVSLGCLLTVGVVPAVEWEDLSVNAINRLPPRTYAMPLASEAAALTDALGCLWGQTPLTGNC